MEALKKFWFRTNEFVKNISEKIGNKKHVFLIAWILLFIITAILPATASKAIVFLLNLSDIVAFIYILLMTKSYIISGIAIPFINGILIGLSTYISPLQKLYYIMSTLGATRDIQTLFTFVFLVFLIIKILVMINGSNNDSTDEK